MRFKCNDKKTRGLLVNYKSTGGYVGPDAFDTHQGKATDHDIADRPACRAYIPLRCTAHVPHRPDRNAASAHAVRGYLRSNLAMPISAGSNSGHRGKGEGFAVLATTIAICIRLRLEALGIGGWPCQFGAQRIQRACPANLRQPSSFQHPHRSRPNSELRERCAVALALAGLIFHVSQPLPHPGRFDILSTDLRVGLETPRLCYLHQLRFSGSFLGVVRQPAHQRKN